jgi:nucleotide-binding universal stress UspA family protein
VNTNIRRILVPVDFSPCSNHAVAYAARLAKKLDASLELLHVVDDPVTAGAWGSEIYVPDLAGILASVATDAESRLAVAVAGLRGQGLSAGSLVRQGHPERTIVEHAAEGRFDLVVMGSHGRTGLSHALLGSVAERVLRHAPCAVLTITDAAARQSSSDAPAA